METEHNTSRLRAHASRLKQAFLRLWPPLFLVWVLVWFWFSWQVSLCIVGFAVLGAALAGPLGMLIGAAVSPIVFWLGMWLS